MKKIILIVLFLMSINIYAGVRDKIGLLASEDIAVLNEKIEGLEKESKIEINMVIDENDVDSSVEEELNSQKRKISIFVIKYSNNKYKLKMLFTKDINIIAYKEEVNRLMDNLETLFNGEMYTDVSYEIVGNVSSVIKLIDLEKKEMKRNKTRAVITKLVRGIIILIVVFAALLIARARINSQKHNCKYCKIKMDLVDDFEEKGKNVYMYTCHVCGYSKRIISNRK